MPIITNKMYKMKSQGFSLLEVLISLTILAVGLLGMAALQNEALKFNHAAFTDSQAQFLINDMVERIRSNRGNSTYSIGYATGTPSASVNCAGDTCTPAQMATWDIAQWRARVENSDYIPSGESAITFNASNRTFVVSVRYVWSQLNGADITDGKRTISVTTRIE